VTQAGDHLTIPRPAYKGDWEERAKCKGRDPDIFFPRTRNFEVFPKWICSQCEVREECLTYAIDFEEPKGIWGGMNPTERIREAAKRRKKK
jgi:WhiB family redox-sensing transcriptional regulator